MKKIVLLIFLTNLYITNAQQVEISGRVIDSLQPIENIHIVNKNSKQGTFTNNKGKFTLKVTLNDTLKVSSISHQEKNIIISKKDIITKFIIVKLKQSNTLLDEVVIKKHNLTGNLITDIKQIPKEHFNEKLSKKINTDYKKLATQIKIQAPTGLVFSLGKSAAQKRRLKRNKLKEKREFPTKLLAKLGSHFFYNELKIPRDKYYHFITYCSYNKKVEELFKSDKIFELIGLLQNESVAYLKINKTNK